MALRPVRVAPGTVVGTGALAPVGAPSAAGAVATDVQAMHALFQQQLLMQQRDLLSRQGAGTGRRSGAGGRAARAPPSSHGGRKGTASEIAASRWGLIGEIILACLNTCLIYGMIWPEASFQNRLNCSLQLCSR